LFNFIRCGRWYIKKRVWNSTICYIKRERTNPSFVVQQNYRVGNYAEAFYGPEGKHVGTYLIDAVDEKNDTVTLRDLE
jgi:hypothetical protein